MMMILSNNILHIDSFIDTPEIFFLEREKKNKMSTMLCKEIT